MSTVVIEVRYRTVAITLSAQTEWIRWTISEEMKCAMATATQVGADARKCPAAPLEVCRSGEMSRLQVARHPLVRLRLRRRRRSLARRFPKSRALNIVVRRHRRERRQILRPDAGRRLESRGQFDQSGLAECRPKEADSERHAEHRTRRHVYDWIPLGCCET